MRVLRLGAILSALGAICIAVYGAWDAISAAIENGSSISVFWTVWLFLWIGGWIVPAYATLSYCGVFPGRKHSGLSDEKLEPIDLSDQLVPKPRITNNTMRLIAMVSAIVACMICLAYIKSIAVDQWFELGRITSFRLSISAVLILGFVLASCNFLYAVRTWERRSDAS